MKSTKYIAIDKNIIKKNAEFQFNIFALLASKKEMYSFKESGLLISGKDVDRLNKINTLYVEETQYEEYKKFYISYINLQNSGLTKKDAFKNNLIDVYDNASTLLDELFKNPESLANYQISKKIVGNIVNTILDDDFSIELLMSITAHDYYTHTHSINVAIYALSLGHFLKFSRERLVCLGESALLHDLGKSKVDIAIINKNGRLTDNEFTQIKQHPELGYIIALKLGVKNLNILQGIKYHQEKIDGTGYPSGLSGKKIPIFARIIAICDVFDALTSKRSYKDAMSSFEALTLMKTKMDHHLDITLLNQMIRMLK